MDPVSLAATISAFLSPVLPYLLKGGEKAAEEMGKKFGSTVWDKATALWTRLRPRLEASSAAQEILQEVKAPNNQAVQGALEKILAEDSTLVQELSRWLEEAKQAGVRITVASGERSVAVGERVTGSTIITGDSNR